jgi:hypothetical protein
MRVVFESRIGMATYIAGRLLYTDKTTANQHHSRGPWKSFDAAKVR